VPIPEQGLVASFTVQSKDRAGLKSTLAALTDEIRGLMAGKPPQVRDPAYQPVDSGILGEKPPPDNLSVVVGVGASLFDDRFGLADRRPKELVTMPFLANDRLDPKLSHGDLSIILEAGHSDTVQFALRQLMRRTRSDLVLRWMVDGYARGIGAGPASDAATPRNLLGFKDGTANLDVDDDTVMDRHVWVGPDDGEPDWAVGGSYQAVRIIRMFVEFWDRTQLAEQEGIIGRRKVSGAPMGMTDEFADPDYAEDPDGKRIKLDAHIRLANPRSTETEENRILRRGFSYSRGFDGAGRLDQGLAFVAYQRSLQRGFLTVQSRLKGEPLEEYILPMGGGFFFTLPGVTGDDRFLGDQLVG
jgi:deferrochelatase/peroxidase EfeB